MPSECIVHVVEDDRPMRESLVALLEEAGYKVRGYASAEELLSSTIPEELCCVISDVRMPGMDGVTLLRRLRVCKPELPLILITGHGDVPMAVTAMKAGAADFLEKPFEATALLAAIDAAVNRLPGNDLQEGVEAAQQTLKKLTSREYEVLNYLVAGKSNKEVAAKLGISPRTVEFHRAHIMEKAGAKRLPELVRIWIAAQPTSELQDAELNRPLSFSRS
jgi:two-component system, LuxR family, response regulator FixJ